MSSGWYPTFRKIFEALMSKQSIKHLLVDGGGMRTSAYLYGRIEGNVYGSTREKPASQNFWRPLGYGDVAYAALKILTTLATWANNNNAGKSSELALHSEIGSSFTDGQWPLGSEYCTHPSDFFVAMSECGGHFCVGLPVYGPSIHAIGREIFLSSGGQQIPFS
ncbi:hypothetical protein B0H14DRAFT_2605585 [Mycena olivaceomarginata]|nr:hypothetical protein B0H14DRAFT_2605585 [Mycena olivaceomarginata]